AGAGGDAGAVDGGASDAGAPEVEPDGGPREPTGAATQVLFQDDFERWANTAAIKGSYGDQREQNATFSLDGTVAAVGSRSLRIDYPANPACQDADVFIGKVLANTSPLTAVTSGSSSRRHGARAAASARPRRCWGVKAWPGARSSWRPRPSRTPESGCAGR
ncbi:MAG: hypothetical protein MUC96_30580, partial [Myxococcaceae bacterium]|nr:hypothetical protein [Myxococcaceae bacterium]